MRGNLMVAVRDVVPCGALRGHTVASGNSLRNKPSRGRKRAVVVWALKGQVLH